LAQRYDVSMEAGQHASVKHHLVGDGAEATRLAHPRRFFPVALHASLQRQRVA